MATFDEVFEHVVGLEGGYTNDPTDRGGATNFGITERTARAEGYLGDMRDLSLEDAKRIYRKRYWDWLQCDQIAALYVPLAREVFDTAVNCGVGVSGQILQRALNALNRGGTDYADITADGQVGSRTIEALKGYAAKRDFSVLLKVINALQGERYVRICEIDKSQEKFLYGWIKNRVEF